jgi:hypothetical protein
VKRLSYILFVFHGLISVAQKAPIGFPMALDYPRRSQLIQGDSLTTGFLPFKTVTFEKYNTLKLLSYQDKFSVDLLPVSLNSEYAGHHPYATQNQSLLWAAGLQNSLQGGVILQSKYISAQIRPELLYARNPNYEGFPDKGLRGRDRYIWWYQADAPERLSGEHLVRLLPGQSNVKLRYKKFSAGISTENRIWGPGIHNQLVLGANARGFTHFFLQTEAPLRTSIGTLEYEIIGGRLLGSGSPGGNPDDNWRLSTLFQPLPVFTRYYSGIHLVYQPKWTKGLFIGFNSATQQYSHSLRAFELFSSITQRFSRASLASDFSAFDIYGSVFARWVWSNSEIYFELGKKGRDQFRKFMTEPQRQTAYVAGFQKLVPLTKTERTISFSLEATQLAQQLPDEVSQAHSWYIHPIIRHGYTHEGQWLGAGIGPGSNQQTVEISYTSGYNKVGLIGERRHNNSDYYYFVSEEIRDWRRYWVDYSIGMIGSLSLENLIFDGQIRYVYSMNYQWELEEDPNTYLIPGRDVGQLIAQINVSYVFGKAGKSGKR